MSDTRNLMSWLLLGLLTAVGAGAAALGVVQSPTTAALSSCTGPPQNPHCSGAVTNTLSATNYSEVVTEKTSRGMQTDYLVYQAPDRLGGYIQSGNKRTYVVAIGTFVYQSLTVTNNASTAHLTFYRQQSQGARLLDPAYTYLQYAKQGKHITRSGDTYSFTLTNSSKQTGAFSYTVTGQYISEMSLVVGTSSVRLDISLVGSSPPVALPGGAKIVGSSGASGASGPAG
jgi:hypothetical protein